LVSFFPEPRDGAGHWVQQEQASEVSWSLVQFLRGAKAN